MTEAAFVPFSERYGLRPHIEAWGREHMSARHAGDGFGGWGNCERNEIRRCVCPGGSSRKRCCDTATQENALCEACREHCWGSRPDGTQVRLVDAYGPMTG